MDTKVKSNSNVVYNCHYHIVWVPKYRRTVLGAPYDTRLKELIFESVQKWRQQVIELEVMPDYVHLLVTCDPQFGMHRLVRLVKGASSHTMRQEFLELKKKLPSLWNNSYYVGTTGGAP